AVVTGARGAGRVPLRLELVRLGAYLVPAPAQGRHHDRLDDPLDVGPAGVVRAELGAFGRVERALEERADDGRLDARPVELCGFHQLGQLVAGQRLDLDAGE